MPTTKFFRNRGPDRPWPVNRFFHFAADFTKNRMFNRTFGTAVSGISDAHTQMIAVEDSASVGGWKHVNANEVCIGSLGLQTAGASERVSQQFPQAGYTVGPATTTALPNEGIFQPRRVASGGQGWNRFGVNVPLVAGVTYNARLLYREGTSGRIAVYMDLGTNQFINVDGNTGNAFQVNSSGGATSNVVNTNLGNGLWELSYNFVPVKSVTVNISAGPAVSVAGQYVDLLALQVTNGPMLAPWNVQTTTTLAGNVQNIALPLAAQKGICGFWYGDVKSFTASIAPVLISFRGNVNLRSYVEAVMQTTSFTTGMKTIVFGASPGYLRTQFLETDVAAQLGNGFDTNITHMSLGGFGFNDIGNVYAIHKQVGLRYGPVTDAVFNQLKAATALAIA